MGLRTAVETTWPEADVQRCVMHMERNLISRVPKHAREEVKVDYLTIVDAESEKAARAAWRRFVRKWKATLPQGVRSLEEGGDELLTFYRYPKSQWKCLRTNNATSVGSPRPLSPCGKSESRRFPRGRWFWGTPCGGDFKRETRLSGASASTSASARHSRPDPELRPSRG